MAERYYVIHTNALCPAFSFAIKGKQLRVSESLQNRPFVWKPLPNGGTDFAIVDILAEALGFTYTTTLDIPYDWHRYPNGSSSGLIYKVRMRHNIKSEWMLWENLNSR